MSRPQEEYNTQVLNQPAREIWICKKCKSHVAYEKDRTNRDGISEHRFKNPAGLTFLIILFSSVGSCYSTGMPTAEHSWFPPCQWRVSHCFYCDTHLGWEFEDLVPFFGLIKDRLTKISE